MTVSNIANIFYYIIVMMYQVASDDGDENGVS